VEYQGLAWPLLKHEKTAPNPEAMSTRPHPDWKRGIANGGALFVILTLVLMGLCFIADTVPRLAPLANALDLSPWQQAKNWSRATAIAFGCGMAVLFKVAWYPPAAADAPLLSPAFKRSLIYLALAFGFLLWDAGRRRWKPERELRTAHYHIESSASEEATRQTGEALEALHAAWSEFFADKLSAPVDPPLRVKLYRDREEFRFVNRVRGWEEAFYREPFCHAWYDGEAGNPWHWMLHEATHQLNRERAGFKLRLWLEEGIACYFGASQLRGDRLLPGVINEEAYPVWWLTEAELSGRIGDDIAAGVIIPLERIIAGEGGPDMDQAYNTYYLHWFTLVHFLFEFDHQKYRARAFDLIDEGGSLAGFERYVGKVEDIQRQWYGYLIFLQGRELEARQGAVISNR